MCSRSFTPHDLIDEVIGAEMCVLSNFLWDLESDDFHPLVTIGTYFTFTKCGQLNQLLNHAAPIVPFQEPNKYLPVFILYGPVESFGGSCG